MSLFRTGMLVQTAGIRDACENDPEFTGFVRECFERHISGDWGDTCEEDAELNNEAVEADKRGEPSDEIMSVFRTDEERSVWIITEWDRSVTTILFSEEY